MTIENHVVSLELAKQLKEVGYPQESLFYWKNYRGVREDAWELSQKNDPGLLSFSQYAAPLASELGEELPDQIERHGGFYDLIIVKLASGMWGVGYELTMPDAGDNKQLIKLGTHSLSNALAKMWLYLKSEGLL